ncbi:MAG: hypothetical protein RLY85_2036 [Bacteroidota bacterium]|jgi:uncharacterized metal-binding protein YceD (DUF177 family)
MSGRRDYDIAFVGLKPGVTAFNYALGDEFFEAEKPSDFQDCRAQVKLSLDKHPGFMQLKFEIGGTTEMQCNRCGNPLEINLWDDFEVVVKLVDNPEEMNENNDDPDVFFIARTDSHLNVKDWLSEFIQLSMPTYPACDEREMGGPKCNKEVLAMLQKSTENEENISNPIWKGLDKFKDN